MWHKVRSISPALVVVLQQRGAPRQLLSRPECHTVGHAMHSVQLRALSPALYPSPRGLGRGQLHTYAYACVHTCIQASKQALMTNAQAHSHAHVQAFAEDVLIIPMIVAGCSPLTLVLVVGHDA